MYSFHVKSTRNLDITRDIYSGYPDISYLVKLTKLNRPCIFVNDSDNKLVGIMVLNRYDRFLKLCLLVVHPRYRRENIAHNLLQIALATLEDEFNAVDILYTVCPHQFNTDNYQKILLKHGFQVTTVKANGDIVYTYEKPIPKCNR